jgi:histidyl-tRNA synthetase
LDVIWRKDAHQSYLYYDAEVLFIFSQTYQDIVKHMQIDDTPVIHISNRKILGGFLRSLISEEKVAPVSVLIDKYQKIGKDSFLAALQELEISSEIIQAILAFVSLNVDASSVNTLFSLADTPLFQEGVAELKEVLTHIEALKTAFNVPCPYVVDFQIVRGQDYYTGTIFEAMREKDIAFGAVGGGGRYGALTGYIDSKKDTYAGVGASIGLSRLLFKIFETNEKKQHTIAEYLFIHFPETFNEVLALAAKFQSEGKTIEIYPFADKIGKQV